MAPKVSAKMVPPPVATKRAAEGYETYQRALNAPVVAGKIPPPPTDHRGARVWSAKFSEDDIRMIRKMHAGGWTIMDLARRYKSQWLTIAHIVRRESWKHVSD